MERIENETRALAEEKRDCPKLFTRCTDNSKSDCPRKEGISERVIGQRKSSILEFDLFVTSSLYILIQVLYMY